MNSNDVFEPAADRVAGEVIDGEAILIDLVTGVYYSMDGVGGRIWRLVERGVASSAIVDAIVAAYDVERDIAARDVSAVLGELTRDGLIRRSSREPQPADAVAGERLPYLPPQLQRHRDLEDLLALDPPSPGMKQIPWK